MRPNVKCVSRLLSLVLRFSIFYSSVTSFAQTCTHAAVLINIKYSIIFVHAYTWAGRPSKLLGTAQAQDKASEALRGRLNNMGCVMWGGGGWVLVFPSYS